MTFAELRDALLERGALDRAWVQRVNQAEADFWRRNSGCAGFPPPLAPPGSISAWEEHCLTPTTFWIAFPLGKTFLHSMLFPDLLYFHDSAAAAAPTSQFMYGATALYRVASFVEQSSFSSARATDDLVRNN